MNLEYFWETEYKFGKFLKLINNKIYEIKYTQCKSTPAQSSISTRDDKEYIKNKIVENLKCDKDKIKVYGSKFITFPVDKWVAKIELVKKNAMPK